MVKRKKSLDKAKTESTVDTNSEIKRIADDKMMKAAVCAGLLLAVAVAAVQAENIYEKVGHSLRMQRRLGRFEQQPFLETYKLYAASFVLPLHPERKKEDYRNYMPSGDECMNFFRDFRVNQYKLKAPTEFVVLDACLGYLYRNENQGRDIAESNQVKDFLEQHKNDTNLKELWENTKIDELEIKDAQCFSDLFQQLIMARRQFPDVTCNNLYLQVYLQFAECQDGKITEEQRKEDSYMKYIYDMLKEEVASCVKTEVGHLAQALRTAFATSRKERVLNFLLQIRSPLRKQARDQMWPMDVINLLAAVQNTTDEVNQREVHDLLRGVNVEHDIFQGRLLENIAYYATKTIKPRPKTKEEREDATGIKRYNQLIDGLCKFFRRSDKESKYDYATPIVRLVRLLNYEKLFGVSQQALLKDLLTQAQDSSAIYLGVMACNVLSFTEGVLKTPTVNTKQEYKVDFKPDITDMVKWPDAGYW